MKTKNNSGTSKWMDRLVNKNPKRQKPQTKTEPANHLANWITKTVKENMDRRKAVRRHRPETQTADNIRKANQWWLKTRLQCCESCYLEYIETPEQPDCPRCSPNSLLNQSIEKELAARRYKLILEPELSDLEARINQDAAKGMTVVSIVPQDNRTPNGKTAQWLALLEKISYNAQAHQNLIKAVQTERLKEENLQLEQYPLVNAFNKWFFSYFCSNCERHPQREDSTLCLFCNAESSQETKNR